MPNQPFDGSGGPDLVQHVQHGVINEEYSERTLPNIYRILLAGKKETPSLDPLKKRDRGFNELAFFQRLNGVVTAVRQAEATGECAIAGPFLSHRFLRRWMPWVAGLKQNGYVRPANVLLRSMPAAVKTDNACDRVTLRVVEIDQGSAQLLAVTLWTFLRSAAGRTGHQTTTVASLCTNCGAPVETNNQTACRFCGAGVAILGPEWVLDDIANDTDAARFAA